MIFVIEIKNHKNTSIMYGFIIFQTKGQNLYLIL